LGRLNFQFIADHIGKKNLSQKCGELRCIEKIKVNELIRKLVISKIIASLPYFEVGGNWS
jgi:hypothetical protein